jgi:3-hydroxybutyryl-CoA dehydrogenase
MEIKKVAVIGSGIMGHGIAQVVATAAIGVRLYDLSDDLLKKAEQKISDSLEKGIKKGKIEATAKQNILGRIEFAIEFERAVEGADLVVEAVPENLEMKKTIFTKLSEMTKPTAVLATNTSQYSITEIASVVADPTRVIGMHWFNPPVAMKLIEIIRGLDTAGEVVDKMVAFSQSVGKETVVCADSQGFISTRVLLAMRLECYRLLEEGVATMEDIDKTLRLAFGHPMGQFELADFSGLDIELPSCESLSKVFGDRFRPTQNLVHRVKSGRLGRKTGRGWYNYRQ